MKASYKALPLLFLWVCPIFLSPKLVIAAPAPSDYITGSSLGTYSGGSLSTPPPVVYGTGINGAPNQILQQGLPILGNVLNGGGIGSVLSGGSSILSDQLGKLDLDPKTTQALQNSLPLLQQLMSGNGNIGSTLSSAIPMISDLVGGDTGKLLGQYGPALGQLLSGNFSMGSLLSVGSSVLGGLFGNNTVFSTTSGVLGGLFGGSQSSGTGIDLSGPLNGVFSNDVLSNASGQIFGSSDTTSDSSGTVLAQTGTILCLYNTACIQSNPTMYRSLYADATGAMGVANPNEVRSRIAQLSQSGVRPDAFASKQNSEQNAYYVGNYTDKEIARATTQAVLSKTGQLSQKAAIQAAQQTAKTLTQLSDQCDKNSHSSQELIRCSMKIQTATPSFEAAQLALQTSAQTSDQMHTILLGNISSSTDGLNRAQDVDRNAISARLFKDATMSLPVAGTP